MVFFTTFLRPAETKYEALSKFLATKRLGNITRRRRNDKNNHVTFGRKRPLKYHVSMQKKRLFSASTHDISKAFCDQKSRDYFCRFCVDE